MSERAYLVMDLVEAGEVAQARRLLNRNREISGDYDGLLVLAAITLDAGYSPLVDTVFLRGSRRALVPDLARQKGRPCTILDLIAPEEVLRWRVTAPEAQGADPSEADVAVLDRRPAVDEP